MIKREIKKIQTKKNWTSVLQLPVYFHFRIYNTKIILIFQVTSSQ